MASFSPFPLPNVVLQVRNNTERKSDIFVATLKEGKGGGVTSEGVSRLLADIVWLSRYCNPSCRIQFVMTHGLNVCFLFDRPGECMLFVTDVSKTCEEVFLEPMGLGGTWIFEELLLSSCPLLETLIFT